MHAGCCRTFILNSDTTVSDDLPLILGGAQHPVVLTALGATRGPADESTFRRAFALVSADVLDWVLGAWLDPGPCGR